MMTNAKPHILIVDDEPDAANYLVRMLESEYKVQCAPDAPHVLNVALRKGRTPDLILLDVSMPRREGFEICRLLKADERTRDVPVMLITQRDNAEDEVCALKMGAADCISRPFSLEVVKTRIRNQVSLKINNDRLERYANQDSLTEIANRRRFNTVLDAEWRRALRDGHPISLLMVDVDCFKQYNDFYGHVEGDKCLRRLAGAMARELTRPSDLLARYGGEEFAVILPGTELEGARMIGERLRKAIVAMKIPHSRQDGVRNVTISVGCASACPVKGMSYQTLLKTADEQLYAAKNNGRNCVHAWKLPEGEKDGMPEVRRRETII